MCDTSRRPKRARETRPRRASLRIVDTARVRLITEDILTLDDYAAAVPDRRWNTSQHRFASRIRAHSVLRQLSAEVSGGAVVAKVAEYGDTSVSSAPVRPGTWPPTVHHVPARPRHRRNRSGRRSITPSRTTTSRRRTADTSQTGIARPHRRV